MKHLKIWAFLGLAFALSGCVDTQRQIRNADRDSIECSNHGGLYFRAALPIYNVCFAIDSIIPLTGPREGTMKEPT